MRNIEYLHIDGTDESGALSGDANNAPFYVFDEQKQLWVAGPFRYRFLAVLARSVMKHRKENNHA